MTSSPKQGPAVPKLQLSHFETGGGWGLGDQFARLPPAAEQEKSGGNIYRVAPEDVDGQRRPTDGGHAQSAGHSPGATASRPAIPETSYVPGGGEEDDDNTFIDHGSSAHAPITTTSAGVAPHAVQAVANAHGGTSRPPVVKSAPAAHTRLGSPLQDSTSAGMADGLAAQPTSALLGGRGAAHGISSSTVVPTAARSSMAAAAPSLPPPRVHGTSTPSSLPSAASTRQSTSVTTIKPPPTTMWDPPRVLSRMSLTQPVRDMAIDPQGDRLWMAVGDDPLAVLELRGMNLHTSKTLDNITQVYCMAVVEVPNGRQTSFKNVEEKRPRKKRSSALKDESDGTVPSHRYELWCGLGRGNISIVDLEHGSDAGVISRAHGQPVHKLWYLANGKVWSAGRDKAVRVWDPQARRKIKNRNIAAILSDLVYVPHTRQVWATADDNVIRIYEGGGDNATLQRAGHDRNDNLVRTKGDINALAYHAEANVVWVCMGRTTALMDPRTYEVAVTLNASVSAVSFYQKTAIVAGQGRFFGSDACCLVVLDVTDPLSPTMLFRGITVDAVNRIGLRLFYSTPLAVIAHDEGKNGNKKHKLSVFTYDETVPLGTYVESEESNRPPQQRQETVGYRNGVGSAQQAGRAVAGAASLALAGRPISAASTPLIAGHLALGASNASFGALPASSTGGLSAAVLGARHISTTNMLSLAAMSNLGAGANVAGGGDGAAGNAAGGAAELGNSTAVLDAPPPIRPTHREAESVIITPGPAAPPRNSEVVASLAKLEKRTEEVCGLLTNARRTEGPLADLAKLHGEASTWLIGSDVPALLPVLSHEETERIESEYWTPEGCVLATLMARLRLAATKAHQQAETAAAATGASVAATADAANRRSPKKQTSPQSPSSSLSLAPNPSYQSPPTMSLQGGSAGVTSYDHVGNTPMALDAKFLTAVESAGNTLLSANTGMPSGRRSDAPALVALGGAGRGADGAGAESMSSEAAVLQWVAQLSHTSQEERRLHQRQLQSLQRHNKRITERNASLVNGMTKVCESVRNWGQRIADEADAQLTRLSPQASLKEADHQRLFISITRRSSTDLDDVLTTSGPREIRNFVTRIQSCISRIVALQEKTQQFFLSCTTESRALAATSAAVGTAGNTASTGAFINGTTTHGSQNNNNTSASDGGDLQTSTRAGSMTAGTNPRSCSQSSSPPPPSASVPASAGATASMNILSHRGQPDQAEASVLGLERTIAPEPAKGTTAAAAADAATPSPASTSAALSAWAVTTGSAEAIIEAGLAPPLAPAQFVSFLSDQARTLLQRIAAFSVKTKRSADVHRVLYAPYYEACAATASTSRTTASTNARTEAAEGEATPLVSCGTPAPEVDLTPIPVLDLGTDFTTFPVLWDLEVAHTMYELCVLESHTLILDALASEEGIIQCVPAREDQAGHASSERCLDATGAVEAEDDGQAPFQPAVVGTAEYTQRLADELKENMSRTNGLAISLQKRLLVAGFFEDYDSPSSQSETIDTIVGVSRRTSEMSETLDEKAKRMRSTLARTLEKLTDTVLHIDAQSEFAQGQVPLSSVFPAGHDDGDADTEDADGTSRSTSSYFSPSPVLGTAAGELGPRGHSVSDPTQPSSAAPPPSAPSYTVHTPPPSARPVRIFGGFLGMDARPRVHEGRLRGGVYWAHIYLDFLQQCLKVASDVLSPEKLTMPRDNFLAITEMIVDWREQVEKMGSACLTVRNTLATTQSDLGDIFTSVAPHMGYTTSGAPHAHAGSASFFGHSQSSSGEPSTWLPERAAGSPPGQHRDGASAMAATNTTGQGAVGKSASSLLSAAAATHMVPASKTTSGATDSGLGGFLSSPIGADSWLRSMRSSTGRPRGDGTGGASRTAVGGLSGAAGNDLNVGEGASPLNMVVRNSFELNLLSVCMRIYLHQSCTPSPSSLRAARSLADLEGFMLVPLLLQSHMEPSRTPAGTGSGKSDVNTRLGGTVDVPSHGVGSRGTRSATATGADVGDGAGRASSLSLHNHDLVDSPHTHPIAASALDGTAANDMDVLDRTRVGLQEIIASLDAIILKVQQAHLNCRAVDARVTVIIEENTKLAALADKRVWLDDSKGRGSSSTRRGAGASHSEATYYDPSSSTTGIQGYSSTEVRLSTDPLLLSRLSGGGGSGSSSAPLANGFDSGTGGYVSGGAAEAMASGGSGSYAESSPHRSITRHSHHRKSSEATTSETKAPKEAGT